METKKIVENGRFDLHLHTTASDGIYSPCEIVKMAAQISTWKKKAEQYSKVSVFQLPAKVTLGQCLNFAVSKAKYEIIAKFDDDDYYSPNYIAQAMQVFEEKQADIVGESKVFTYIQMDKRLCIRKTWNPIGGGTIMFRKRVFEKVQFPAKNSGEDNAFLKDAKKRGFKICTTNPYNYVYIRKGHNHHAWKVSGRKLRRNCSNIMITNDYIPHVSQAP
ncbi:glycosyltransferase [Cytobacillus depressus]|uniref:Glycosyltransferase n=1 Tax=Cytobacillus depressus TaxID=1602942 RepID=A0A6L3UYG8_9BACI|nr:glycosyltransferase [Cytobacillus depressus]KAB2329369.1 glycosyltransferase [Cytobacillus depressus]